MRLLINAVIVLLFVVSVWIGLAQEVVIPDAFQPAGVEHYPYWWDRAESGLHKTWDRLERMGVWVDYE